MNISITINKCIGESSPVYLYCSKIIIIVIITNMIILSIKMKIMIINTRFLKS